MPPEFLSFLSRVGARRLSSMSGVSLNTITGIASGAIKAGPRVSTWISDAMGQYKVNLMIGQGASRDTAEVVRRLPFAKVDKYVDRFGEIVNAVARDRFIPGEGYTRAEVREMILDGMANSSKGVTEMYDRYVG